MARLAPHASWTSAATHAVLPLLAARAASGCSSRAGIAAHRARFGDWEGGLWLPECAHAPWLDPLLEEAGVHATCVDLTDTGARRAYPRCARRRGRSSSRSTARRLSWCGARTAIRRAAPYRDTHALTEYHHQAWAVDGGPYEPARAAVQASADARDFVAAGAARDGLSVVALDTELLGVHWHEGARWLREVLVAADAGRACGAPAERRAGRGRARRRRRSCRDVVGHAARSLDLERARGRRAGLAPARMRAGAVAAAPAVPDRALRELLALQSSDWAFLVSAGTAGEYPAERAAGHAEGSRRRSPTRTACRRRSGIWHHSSPGTPWLAP